MSVLREKPVMSAAAATSTVSVVVSAVVGLLVALDVWHPSPEQVAAIVAAVAAVTVAASTLFGKLAASNVYIPASVRRLLAEQESTIKAEERVAVAESFSRPHPITGPVGGAGGRSGPGTEGNV